MNGKWMPIILTVALVIGLPRLVYGVWVLTKGAETEPTETTAISEVPAITVINVLTNKQIAEMDIEEYLVGVLLGEIPGDFHIEAQMAQAVVARTYTLRTTQYKEKHPSNAICTNSGCCQCYRDPTEYLLSGGNEERVALAREAVRRTRGQVLLYDGLPIDATYFSCSGGKTEDALAVWGVDVPYLQSVSSPGEEQATYYWDSVQFTQEEFQRALGQKLSGTPDHWFGKTTYTNGGGVDTMRIGGRLYTGTDLRTLLGLRSTAFSVTVSNGNICITTKGFGHRVGMSQYGAQAMALTGKEYGQILSHYYPGAVIDKEAFFG